MILKSIYILSIIMFFISTRTNKNYFLDEMHFEVNLFNSTFNQNVQKLNKEIIYLNDTKTQLSFVNYKIKDDVVYFDIDGSGVYFKNIPSYPNQFSFYNLKEARDNLNAVFNNSLLEIVYSQFKSINNHRHVVYSTDFSEKWVNILQNKSLALNSFKASKNVTRDNTEFILYDLYKDSLYNKEMFTIVFPEYDHFNRSLKLRALWYFDFNKDFFAQSVKRLHKNLGLNISIIDSKYRVVYSTNLSTNTTIEKLDKFYNYSLDKTKYKILIEKENLLHLIRIKEIILIILNLALIFFISKKDNLEKEIISLKIERKLKKQLLLREPLTSLYNRYFLQEEMPFPLKKCGVILLDIDHFKIINDNFGHSTGDHVLKAISNCIKLVSRGGTYAFRWGGEEFLIVFHNMEEDVILKKTEQLQNLIRKLTVIDNYKITASFGVVFTELQDKDTLFSAISAADEKLYEAKKTGRDKIVF